MNQLLLLLLVVFSGNALAAEPSVRRVAVLVGANQSPPGRPQLQFSYRDAQSMADVLVAAGQFASNDVHVLLDPTPANVLSTLDEQLAVLGQSSEETLLVFYYSGHADDSALYPNGQSLPLQSLKERLENPNAKVRIGIVDSCSGGGWTQTKGLQADHPFSVRVPLVLTSEGSALIASSSGLESAHESKDLQGSFFTHHFVAGLRGAAARTGDGQVTLGDAFAYAQERTIRDSAAQAETPQHPSFDFHLRGRQDLVLTRADSSPSLVELDEALGPLQVIQMKTGLVLLEVPSGKRTLKLALPPGRYIVQRRSGDQVFAKEVTVEAGSSVRIEEEGLTLVGRSELAVKGALAEPLAIATTVPKGEFELRVETGVIHGDLGPSIFFGGGQGFTNSLAVNWGITDRLQWPIGLPTLAYRFGERGEVEWVPWGGISNWGFAGGSSGSVLLYELATGLDTRLWFGQHRSLNTSLSTFSNLATIPLGGGTQQRVSPDTWAARFSVGYSHTLYQLVTFNLGLAWSQNYVYEGKFPGRGQDGGLIALGSVQAIGGRQLPLVEVHLARSFSLDGYASVGFDLHGNVQDSYLGGLTWTW